MAATVVSRRQRMRLAWSNSLDNSGRRIEEPRDWGGPVLGWRQLAAEYVRIAARNQFNEWRACILLTDGTRVGDRVSIRDMLDAFEYGHESFSF